MLRIHFCPLTEVVRRSRNQATRNFGKTWQGRFTEPPLMDHSPATVALLATRYWLEGEACKAFTGTVRVHGGDDASCSLGSEFIDGVADAVHVARIHNKQIACTVKGQTLRTVRHGTKSRPTLPA
jgi:hypothetical protein